MFCVPVGQADGSALRVTERSQWRHRTLGVTWCLGVSEHSQWSRSAAHGRPGWPRPFGTTTYAEGRPFRRRHFGNFTDNSPTCNHLRQIIRKNICARLSRLSDKNPNFSASITNLNRTCRPICPLKFLYKRNCFGLKAVVLSVKL